MTITSHSSRLRTWLRWCPALLFAIIIFYFSSMPGDEVEKTYNSLDTITQPMATASAIVTSTVHATPKAPSAAKSVATTVSVTATNPKASITPTALPISSVVGKIPIFSTLDLLKASHAIGYFWLGWTVLFAFGLQSRGSPVTSVTLCILYAVADEFHQSFVPARSATARDILIDTLAALMGVALLIALIKTRTFFRQRQASSPSEHSKSGESEC